MAHHFIKSALLAVIAGALVSTAFMPMGASVNTSVDKKGNMPEGGMITQRVFPNVVCQTPSPHIANDQGIPPHRLQAIPHHYTNLIFDRLHSHPLLDSSINRNQASKLNSSYIHEKADGNYTPHDPIWIDGDDAFTAENGVVGGDGTADDPYIIEGWEITTSYDAGIVVINTRSYFLVRQCSLESYFGVGTDNVTNGIFDNILFYCWGGVGLQLESSSNITLSNLTINAWTGFQAQGLNYLTMTNCSFICSDPGGYGVGISQLYASFTHLSHVTIHDFDIGLLLYSAAYSTITDCDVYANNLGMVLLASPHQTLRGNRLYDNTFSLDIEGSIAEGHVIDDYYHDIDQSNTIDGKPVYYLYNQSNLVFDGTTNIGFFGFIHCTNITIQNIDMTSLALGVLYVATSHSSVISCDFSNCWTAIGLVYGSESNTIRDCTSDGANIILAWSPHNVLRGNSIGTLYNAFAVYGDTIQDFYQDIDQSNTIGGKPMYYLVGVRNKVFKETNVGYLALIDCKNMIVSQVNMSGLSTGLLLAQSRVIIRKSVFQFNDDGIRVALKSNSHIIDSTISGNFFGVEFDHASAVAVVRCNVSGNMVGFNYDYSHDTVVRDCTISYNSNGFQIQNSWDNVISHNTISFNGWGGINFGGDCQGNEVVGNTFSYGWTGVILGPDSSASDLYQSPSATNNSVYHNEFSQMGLVGIDVDINADRNVIHHNNVTENEEGLWFWNCGENNTIMNNDIQGNFYGARAWNCQVNVTRNWWGSADGPSGIGHGTGDSVIPVYHAKITFDPWLEQAAKTTPTLLEYLLPCLRVRLRSFAQ
jgi:parallel beta-helix repeat protein